MWLADVPMQRKLAAPLNACTSFARSETPCGDSLPAVTGQSTTLRLVQLRACSCGQGRCAARARRRAQDEEQAPQEGHGVEPQHPQLQRDKLLGDKGGQRPQAPAALLHADKLAAQLVPAGGGGGQEPRGPGTAILSQEGAPVGSTPASLRLGQLWAETGRDLHMQRTPCSVHALSRPRSRA